MPEYGFSPTINFLNKDRIREEGAYSSYTRTYKPEKTRILSYFTHYWTPVQEIPSLAPNTAGYGGSNIYKDFLLLYRLTHSSIPPIFSETHQTFTKHKTLKWNY